MAYAHSDRSPVDAAEFAILSWGSEDNRLAPGQGMLLSLEL